MSDLKARFVCEKFEFDVEVPLVLFGIQDVANSMIQNLIPGASATDDSGKKGKKHKGDSEEAKFSVATALMLAASLGLSALGSGSSR